MREAKRGNEFFASLGGGMKLYYMARRGREIVQYRPFGGVVESGGSGEAISFGGSKAKKSVLVLYCAGREIH